MFMDKDIIVEDILEVLGLGEYGAKQIIVEGGGYFRSSWIKRLF